MEGAAVGTSEARIVSFSGKRGPYSKSAPRSNSREGTPQRLEVHTFGEAHSLRRVQGCPVSNPFMETGNFPFSSMSLRRSV